MSSSSYASSTVTTKISTSSAASAAWWTYAVSQVRSWFPVLEWAPKYKKAFIIPDMIAGVTVGVMLIPQGMAYASLAELPPIYGLYACIMPIFLYALMGGSHHLAVGPVALLSLLVAETVSSAKDAHFAGVATDSPNYEADVLDFQIKVSFFLSFISGLVLLALSVLRLGFLVNFLSHPVLAGFTTGAAGIIGASQFKSALEIDLKKDTFFVMVYNVFTKIEDVNWWAFLMTVVCVAALLAFKFSGRRWPKVRLVPSVVVVVFVATMITYLAQLDDDDRGSIQIVGEIPSGVNIVDTPKFDWDVFQEVAVDGVLIALIGFLESISVAKAFSTKYKYEIDADTELRALGVANVIGSFFSAYPTTGGFSRTAVNAVAGAKTLAGSFVSVLIIIATLLFLTPLFVYLPKPVLAAIVLAAVLGLLEIRLAMRLWKTDRRDFWVLCAACLFTLALGIETGLILAAGLSLGIFLFQTSKPHTAVLGRMPDSTTYRNVKRYDEARTISDVSIFRFDAPLFFGNADNFAAHVKSLVPDEVAEAAADADASATDGSSYDSEAALPQVAHVIILDFHSVFSIDSTGVHVLHDLVVSLVEKRVAVVLAGVRGPVRDVLSNPYNHMHELFVLHATMYREVHDAVVFAKQILRSQAHPQLALVVPAFASASASTSASASASACDSDLDTATATATATTTDSSTESATATRVGVSGEYSDSDNASWSY